MLIEMVLAAGIHLAESIPAEKRAGDGVSIQKVQTCQWPNLCTRPLVSDLELDSIRN